MSSLSLTCSCSPVPVWFITVHKLAADRHIHLVIWGKDLSSYFTMLHILVSLPHILSSLHCHRHLIQAWNTQKYRSKFREKKKNPKNTRIVQRKITEIKHSHWHLSLSSSLYFSPSVDCLATAHGISTPSRYFKQLEKGLMIDRTVATHWCQSLPIATQASFLCLTIIREKMNPRRGRKTNKTVTGAGNITRLQDVL